MFPILYEHQQPWPAEGALRVEVPRQTVDITVSPDAARRKANAYLGLHVAMALRASNPVLVLREPPVWRFSMDLHLPRDGYVATLGAIEVDAHTRTVFPLSAEEIARLQDRADELAARLAPHPAPAG